MEPEITRSPSIYKMDSAGNIREWYYEVQENRWRSVAGVLGGTMTVHEWTRCTPKSQPTGEEQAAFEADAALKQKLDREYYDNLEDAKSGVPAMFKAMLATDITKVKEDKMVFPAYIQPKLDGIRCIISAEGAVSRSNQPILSIPHILKALEPFFEKNPDVILDGELYNHELREDFQKITSIVRRDLSEGQELSAKKEAERLDNLEQSRKLIQYHVYDAAGSQASHPHMVNRTLPYTDMFCDAALHPLTPTQCLQFVPSIRVLDLKGAKEVHGWHISEGYEGSILRLDGPYEHKRSRRLLKMKVFDTAEFTIDSIVEGNGNWTGCAKNIVYRLDSGQTFGTGVRGSMEAMRKVLENAGDYIGTIGTVRYMGLTDDGLPRHGVTIDFHGAERTD